MEGKPRLMLLEYTASSFFVGWLNVLQKTDTLQLPFMFFHLGRCQSRGRGVFFSPQGRWYVVLHRSVQVNLDNETQPHTDGNNVLASQIWGCGNYRGGDLLLWSQAANGLFWGVHAWFLLWGAFLMTCW